MRHIAHVALKAVLLAWQGRIGLFWPIWIVMSIVSAVCAALVSLYPESATASVVSVKARTTRLPIASQRRSDWNRALIAVGLLALFLVCYLALMMKWEDFAYYDGSYLTLYPLRALDYAPPIWQDSGRFFPLGHQEFNLIRHFTNTNLGYHALNILQLLILCFVLLTLDEDLSTEVRVGLVAVLLITPSILTSFGDLIYSDRNVVFCLAFLAFAVKRFERTHATVWAVIAAISTQIMIYEKETAFLLVLGFAFGRLLLGSWNRERGVWDYHRLWDKERRLDLFLIFLVILFLLYFVAATYPPPAVHYADETRLTRAKAALSYIEMDPLAWLFVAFAISRAYRIVRGKIVLQPFWDPLALGGLACFAAYTWLGMSGPYYLAPVDLIAVLYVGHFLTFAWAEIRLSEKSATAVLLGAILIQTVSLSAFFLYQRKNLIHAKAQIADVIQANYQSGSTHTLFFPFSTPYVVSEFAAYLNYRGIPTLETDRPDHLVMACAAVEHDMPCVKYSDLVLCHARRTPEAGDLVIVLPDDNAPLAEVNAFRRRGDVIFSYQPYPRIPLLLRSVIEHVHISSPLFNPFSQSIQWTSPHTFLPDRWLDASISMGQ